MSKELPKWVEDWIRLKTEELQTYLVRDMLKVPGMAAAGESEKDFRRKRRPARAEIRPPNFVIFAPFTFIPSNAEKA